MTMRSIASLRQRLRELGAKPCHEDRVLQAWSRVLSIDTRHRKAEDFLPLKVREAWPAISAELDALATLRSAHPGEDGSERLLVDLADGQCVESVLLPGDGLCVSTQVGCAVGCSFCMTGRSGLLRQLGSAEIVAQVVLARSRRSPGRPKDGLAPSGGGSGDLADPGVLPTRRKVKRVVFMGMGEPAHNLDNVLEAIDLLGTVGAIGHKNLVFSTVGDRRVFERLPQGRVKPALALSLHTTRAELRAELLPKAPRIDPAELVELGEAYARLSGYPIQYQWTLLAGVNDSEAEAAAIAELLAGKYAMMNFIPFNAGPGLPYTRPAAERANWLAGYLHQRGIVARLRQSAGQDVDGGCGQLRARRLTRIAASDGSSPAPS
jgi:23S rRNA (adenine2503-C2)-methyltransferase